MNNNYSPRKNFAVIVVGAEDDALWYSTLAEARKEWAEFKKLGYNAVIVKVVK